MKTLLIGILALGTVTAFAQKNPNDTEYGRCFLDVVQGTQMIMVVSNELQDAMEIQNEKRLDEIYKKSAALAKVVCKNKAKQ